MMNNSDKARVTMAMEFVRDGQEPLFLIHANNSVLGNHKYGSFEHSILMNSETIRKGVKAQLFEISCMEKEGRIQAPTGSMSFYNCHGVFDQEEIVTIRPFRSIRKVAYLRQANLFATHTTIEFNSVMRRWARSHFASLQCIGDVLSDMITFKLLMHGYLSFHGAGIEIDGTAYLITGLPDTGKTYSAMQLVAGGANFISEDIILVNKEMITVGLPFTQTIEKRKKRPPLEKMRATILQALYKQNYSKDTFFDTPYYTGTNVCNKAPIAGVFFLRRGQARYELADKKKMLRDLINLSRLEFGYGRNRGLLAYLFFNGDSTMDDFFDKENQILTRLVDSVPMYNVFAPDHTGFAPIMESLITDLSK